MSDADDDVQAAAAGGGDAAAGGAGGDAGDDGDAAAATTAGGGQWWSRKLDELPEDEALNVERAFPWAEPPADLVAELLPFQRESLFWMKRQEESGFRGGILADVSAARARARRRSAARFAQARGR